jgi:multidrug resistance efflux pump
MAAMPPRKRKKVIEPELDPLARFAAAITASDAKAAAERKRIKDERIEAERVARLAAEHAEAVRLARRALDRAIASAKAARGSGKGVAEADAAWKQAKARVIELETGAPPSWDRAAPGPNAEPGEPADG